MGIPYMGKTIFILRRGQGSWYNVSHEVSEPVATNIFTSPTVPSHLHRQCRGDQSSNLIFCWFLSNPFFPNIREMCLRHDSTVVETVTRTHIESNRHDQLANGSCTKLERLIIKTVEIQELENWGVSFHCLSVLSAQNDSPTQSCT